MQMVRVRARVLGLEWALEGLGVGVGLASNKARGVGFRVFMFFNEIQAWWPHHGMDLTELQWMKSNGFE